MNPNEKNSVEKLQTAFTKEAGVVTERANSIKVVLLQCEEIGK